MEPISVNDQIGQLKDKVEKGDIPEELKINLISQISRLALVEKNPNLLSSNYILDYENISSYVKWILSLPWNKVSQDTLDLSQAKAIFDKNHYGLESVKNRMLEYLATIVLNLKNNRRDHVARAPILCLVGLAGTGKTTLAASIAEALGRKFERIPFGGMGDARALRGQSRAFPEAEPGFIIKKLASANFKNCVILLDELDRVTTEARADLMGVLIELLDAEQNKNFIDNYIDYPFDLSEVLFIATANNTTNISTAVLDRLEIIQMPSYTDAEKTVIGKDFLFPKIRNDSGLVENQLTIDDAIWPSIIRPLGFDSGIRSLEREIEGICRKAARMIVEGKTQQVRVSTENLREFLTQL